MNFKKSDMQHGGEMSEFFFWLSDFKKNANTCNSLYDKSSQNQNQFGGKKP